MERGYVQKPEQGNDYRNYDRRRSGDLVFRRRFEGIGDNAQHAAILARSALPCNLCLSGCIRHNQPSSSSQCEFDFNHFIVLKSYMCIYLLQ